MRGHWRLVRFHWLSLTLSMQATIGIQDFTDLLCQDCRRERLLDEFHIRIQHAVMNDRFICVAGHEHHLHCRAHFNHPVSYFLTAYFRHDHVG